MGLPIEKQARVWGIAAAVFLVVLWFLGDVILPFVLGGAIAYCLDPIADRLERLGLSRAVATTLITLVRILLFVVMALAVVPTLVEQAVALVNVAPELAKQLQAFLTERFPDMMDEQSVIRQSLSGLGETIRAKGGALIEGVLTSALSLLNVLLLVVHRAGGGVLPAAGLGPDDRQGRRSAAARSCADDPAAGAQIDDTLASFIRGQGTVMLILGVYSMPWR